MTAACIDPAAIARKAQSVVLRRLQADASQKAVALAMGVNESTVSRLINDHLAKFCLLLAHCGLKVVPIEARCFKPEEVDALVLLAKRHMASVTSSQQLEWDDD